MYVAEQTANRVEAGLDDDNADDEFCSAPFTLKPVHTGDKSCRKRRQIVAEAIVAENGNKSCPKRRQIVAVFGNFCRHCGQAITVTLVLTMCMHI